MAPEMNVLVVDDDPDIREMLSMVLNLEGHRVGVASGPKETEGVIIGMERKYGRVEVAFVDLFMPPGVRTGDKLISEIGIKYPYIASILMTANGRNLGLQDIRKIIEGGAYAVLDKPFNVDTISGLLNRIHHAGREPITRLVTYNESFAP